MAYEKTEWTARQGVNLNRCAKSEETAESVILENTPDSVTAPGTPFSTGNMNHIERGIEDAHNLIAAEARERIRDDADTLASAKSYADAAVAGEAARADAGVAALDAAKIDKSVAGEAGTLMRSFEIGEPATNGVTAEYRSVDVETGAEITTPVDLPVADEDKAGVMPAESFRQIGENTVRIAALENRAVHYAVELDSDRPSQAELQRAYEGASGNEGDAPEQTTLDDTAFGKSYTWYGTAGEWVDRGSSVISQFGNGRPGIIKGENADGKVFAENDGTGSVAGWSGLKARVGGAEAAAAALNTAKAPIANPTFTGAITVPSKTSAAAYAGTAVATEAQVFLKKNCAVFVVGTSMGNRMAAGDVNSLCAGQNDHTAINSAIAALPSEGGKIIIREGTYILGGSINVNRDNVTLEGAGPSTVLLSTANITGGLIKVTGSYCRIAGLMITNSPNVSVTEGVAVTGGNNAVTGIVCGNTTVPGGIGSVGISVTGGNNEISGNVCDNANNIGDSSGQTSNGIVVTGGNNAVTGNVCRNSTVMDIGASTGISVGGDNCVISGNTCANTGGIGIGIGIGGNNCVISGNICSNTGTHSAAFHNYSAGISVGGSNIIVSGNVISNKRTSGQSASNTFALYINSTAHYCAVHGNSLTGVTRASPAGAAYTVNGAAAAALPGSATAIAALNNGGSCGFNIV